MAVSWGFHPKSLHSPKGARKGLDGKGTIRRFRCQESNIQGYPHSIRASTGLLYPTFMFVAELTDLANPVVSHSSPAQFDLLGPQRTKTKQCLNDRAHHICVSLFLVVDQPVVGLLKSVTLSMFDQHPHVKKKTCCTKVPHPVLTQSMDRS